MSKFMLSMALALAGLTGFSGAVQAHGGGLPPTVEQAALAQPPGFPYYFRSHGTRQYAVHDAIYHARGRQWRVVYGRDGGHWGWQIWYDRP